MKLEDQICTLDQARRLHELGIKGPSLYSLWFPQETFSAFTVAELGVMLSEVPGHYAFTVCIEPTKWVCRCQEKSEPPGTDRLKWFDYQHTEAQARAALLIYLLENKIITAEEANQRLVQ